MPNAALSPINVDHGWFTGEDATIRWTFFSPIDPTGFTVQFKMGADQTSASVFTNFASVGSVAAVTGGYTAIASLAVAAADTSGLTPAVYFYALSRINSGGAGVIAYGRAVLQGRPS